MEMGTYNGMYCYISSCQAKLLAEGQLVSAKGFRARCVLSKHDFICLRLASNRDFGDKPLTIKRLLSVPCRIIESSKNNYNLHNHN